MATKKSFLEKIGDVFVPSLTSIGRIAGASSVKDVSTTEATTKAIEAARKVGVSTPQGQKILQSAKGMTGGSVLEKSIPEELAKTDLQVLGEAVVTGLTLQTALSSIIPKGGVNLTAPATKAMAGIAPKLGKVGGALATRAVSNIPASSTYLAARGLVETGKAEDITKNLARGVVWSAIVSPISYGAEKGTEALGKWLYSGLAKYASNKPGATEVLFTKKIVGTANKIKDVLQKDITPIQTKIKTGLLNNKSVITKTELVDKAVKVRTEIEAKAGRAESFNPLAYKKQLESSLKEISEYKLEGTSSILEGTRTGINSKLSSRDYQKKFLDLPDVKQDLLNYRTAIQQAIVERNPGIVNDYGSLFALENTRNALSTMAYKVDKTIPISPLEIAPLSGSILYPQATLPIVSGLVGRRLYMTGLPSSLLGAGMGRLSQFISATQNNPKMQSLLWSTIADALTPKD